MRIQGGQIASQTDSEHPATFFCGQDFTPYARRITRRLKIAANRHPFRRIPVQGFIFDSVVVVDHSRKRVASHSPEDVHPRHVEPR